MKCKIFFISLFLLCIRTHAQQFRGDTLLQVNGTKIFVSIQGKGEPLLVIHGGPGLNHTYLKSWLNPLSQKYTLIYFDQRSMGQSALSVRDSMNPEVFARDIEAIRKSLNIDAWSVLAHSYGAFFAAHYAALYPNQTKALILMNPVPPSNEFDQMMSLRIRERTSSADSLQHTEFRKLATAQKGNLDIAKQWMLLSLKPTFCDSSKVNRFNIELPDSYFVASLSYVGFGDLRVKYNYPDILKPFTGPVSVLHGRCDVIPQEASAAWGGFLKVTQKAGHYSFIEQPAQTRRFIRKAMKPLH